MYIKMRHLIVSLLSIGAVLAAGAAPNATTTAKPRYNDSGELIRPEKYREWIWLTSGLAMTYGPAAAMGASVQLFDNVRDRDQVLLVRKNQERIRPLIRNDFCGSQNYHVATGSSAALRSPGYNVP